MIHTKLGDRFHTHRWRFRNGLIMYAGLSWKPFGIYFRMHRDRRITRAIVHITI